MATQYIGKDHALDLIWQAYERNNTSRIREYFERHYGKIEISTHLYEWAVNNSIRHFDDRFQVGENRAYIHWSMTAKIIDTILDIEGLRHDPLRTYPVNGRAVMGERNFLAAERPMPNQVELDNIEQQLSEVA